jgi:hydrogenase-4 component B
MDAASLNLLNLFALSLLVSVSGAVLSIVLKRADAAARVVAALFGIAAALLGAGAGLLMIFNPPTEVIQLLGPFLLVDFTLQFNPLAGLLVTVISVLALTSWIYSFSYVKEYQGKAGVIGFFMNLFIPAMLLVVTADSAFWFIVFFEVMSLTSYFLVIIDQNDEANRAGLLYLIMSHCGLVLAMIAFFIMASQTGSLSFSSFRSFEFEPLISSLVFLLTFVGFGFKAGLVPLHSWLPLAHPSAPSHVSALMSGGMIKIGIFGIVKVCFDLLAASGVQLWWGIVILIVGAVSSVIGVAYALAEHDIKRLLAYHSCENVGIIALGVGAGVVGLATDQPLLAGLGLMAGLYHLFNHAIFKALLFLGAGSVMFRTHTKNMEHMGGLAHVMPVTAACFLIGSLAISAIPPLNGFVSEWFTYQSLFDAALGGDVSITLVAVFAAVALALTGALAVTCFVKAYGVTFSGKPRSAAAGHAREVPAPMLVGMIALALICVVFGLGAPVIAPVMGQIAAATAAVASPSVAEGITLVGAAPGAVVSTPIIAFLLIGTIIVVALFKRLFSRAGRAERDEPWACGYQPDAHMPVVAANFAENVVQVFKPLYLVRTKVGDWCHGLVGLIDRQVDETESIPWEVPDHRPVLGSVVRLMEWLGQRVRSIEGGNYQVYCLYIMAALVILLLLDVAFI